MFMHGTYVHMHVCVRYLCVYMYIIMCVRGMCVHIYNTRVCVYACITLC